MNEKIEKQVEDWVAQFLGNDFEFRQYQKETIVSIIENITTTHENHNHIIEAPTGSGKSLIAIISAGVLAKYYNIWSYILCSDLFLWDQYADFIKKHPSLTYFGYIKGQSGNYECSENHEDMRNADCRMRGISWATLFNDQTATYKGYSCAKYCEYVQARKRSVKSPVVLMTYQLFLYMINVVTEESEGHNTFTNRPVIFCDECHNIPDIIQGKMTVTVKESDFDKFYDILSYAQNKNSELFGDGKHFKLLEKYPSYDNLKEEIDNIFSAMKNPKTNGIEDYSSIKRYFKLLDLFIEVVEDIETFVKDKKDSLVKSDIDLYKLTSFMRNYMCHWNDFHTAIWTAGAGDVDQEKAFTISTKEYEELVHEGIGKYLIKQVDIDDTKEDDQVTVSFQCTKEDWMTYRFLLSQADWRVMFSATVGGKDAFEENTGIHFTEDKTSKYDVIPSTFNFDKSPVIFLNRYKMSFKDKDNSLEHLIPIIDKTVEKFGSQRGIIQTGTYEIAKKIMFYSSPEIQQRLLLYRGSKEKAKMIEEYKKSTNKILIGPTLCEGIDLPNDLCRFIIILKMPYPNMKDKLVSAKMRLFPLWYNSKTSNAIIQGIGRGVRNESDWCITYIYDACFYNLYINTKEQYSKELQDRIKIYN